MVDIVLTAFLLGISSAPEIFQRTMSETLKDVDGVICQMDDILVHGADQEEHDRRLRATLHCLQEAGITLNIEKCQFFQDLCEIPRHHH